jgi:hypothetical protein
MMDGLFAALRALTDDHMPSVGAKWRGDAADDRTESTYDLHR